MKLNDVLDSIQNISQKEISLKTLMDASTGNIWNMVIAYIAFATFLGWRIVRGYNKQLRTERTRDYGYQKQLDGGEVALSFVAILCAAIWLPFYYIGYKPRGVYTGIGRKIASLLDIQGDRA